MDLDQRDKMEIWKDIKGYEGLYQISNFGRIKSLPRVVSGKGGCDIHVDGCIRKPRIGKAGYYYLNLKKTGASKTYKNHRLVAEYFVDGKSDFRNEVNHIDGDKLNNHYFNLEWTSRQENAIHASKMGLLADVKGFKHGSSKTNNAHVLIMRSLSSIGFTNREISDSFKIPTSHVRRIIKKERWSHI